MINDFYRSRPWIQLMQIIKNERVANDGLIYCEHCGKPIVKAYDCIGHHKEELTEQNVDDANISLNPDNISLVHHKCHNKIHQKLSHSSRNVFLVYGSPLSGKTTYVDEVHVDGDLIVDIDNIWQCVTGNDRYSKDNRLNAVVFGIRDELLRMIKMRVGFWRNAYIVGGYPLISERERLCRTLGAREVFIESNMDECLLRLQSADDGRDKVKWESFIRDWFEKYTPPPLT